MPNVAGKYIIIIGALLVVVGLIWYFYGDKLQWIGHLPGDIHIKRDNFSFYFPITSMILLSLLVNLLLKLFR